MTTSPPSASEPTAASAFDRLHPEIRRWIWEQRWSELRDVQDRAIGAVLDRPGDVLIAAATAAGKTEAAFLPVLTRVADAPVGGLSVLYVAPLKALINDQFRRLEQLCERLDIGIVRWHGDAPQAAKARLLREPRGIALITPESIEALFLRKAGDARRLFGSLSFVVVDELHAFLQGPRGLHLASLLRRIDDIAAARPRRVGLSATIGDLELAASWLAPAAPDTVEIVESHGDAPELRLQIRGCLEPEKTSDADALEAETGPPVALDAIADHLFSKLRGESHLVFAGSRRRVEVLADRLRRRAENAGVPNEFFPHHGSLAKSLRQDLEDRLKRGDLPTTAVATTTLELGIDIGSVTSVAQIGAPRSLASLRQRLGRTGRRAGVPAILRLYVRERELTPASRPLERLRLQTAGAVAAVRLLLAKFVEPPRPDPAVATVVLHQILSLICQRGGMRAEALYRLVCTEGPLSVLTKADFVALLRAMASAEKPLIEQAPDGTLMLGEIGEFLTTGRDFYAVFQSDDEWRLVAGGRTLGTIPMANEVGVGTLLVFAGKRWRVTVVDDRAKVLEVAQHGSARVPRFEAPDGERMHDRLALEVRAVLTDKDRPSYLDAGAARLLAEGCEAYRAFGLDRTPFLPFERDTHVLTWRGSDANTVLAVALKLRGFECEASDIHITVADAEPEQVRAALVAMAGGPSPDAELLAGRIGGLRRAKYDEFVPEALLRSLWTRANADAIAALPALAQMLLESDPSSAR